MRFLVEHGKVEPTERSRGWVFTWNNYTPEDEQAIQAIKCQYLCYGREVAPTTGTPHLQGYVYFEEAKVFGPVRALLPKAWIDRQRAEDPACAYEYCQKSDANYFEKGTRPKSPKQKGQQEKDRWAGYMDSVRQKRLRDIPPEVLCKNLRGIQYAVAQVRQEERDLSDLEELDNFWVYGPQGTGKSSFVMDQFQPEDLYLKDAGDERWDCYQNEDDVMIDDYGGKAGAFPVDYLKRWCAKHRFRVQVRYDCWVIRPKRFWVTSNYHPSQLFKGVDLDAVLRRFKLVHMPYLGCMNEEPGPDWSENCESV